MSFLFGTYYFAKDRSGNKHYAILRVKFIGDREGCVWGGRGERLHFASHSVGEGMSWNKIWRSKGFGFIPMTLSLKRKKRFRTANRIAKLICFIEKWSIRGLKQTEQQDRTRILHLTLNSSVMYRFMNILIKKKKTKSHKNFPKEIDNIILHCFRPVHALEEY